MCVHTTTCMDKNLICTHSVSHNTTEEGSSQLPKRLVDQTPLDNDSVRPYSAGMRTSGANYVDISTIYTVYSMSAQQYVLLCKYSDTAKRYMCYGLQRGHLSCFVQKEEAQSVV